MKLVFYKLPTDAGENVIITESYIYRDSELGILLDDADLDRCFYDIVNDEKGATVVVVEDDPENIEPFFLIDSDKNVEATLPFSSKESAERFLEAVIKWQDFLNKAYDE